MSQPEKEPKDSDFLKQADEQQTGIVREFFDFLSDNSKWWLTPIILALAVLGALIFLTATPAAPFIYTLF